MRKPKPSSPVRSVPSLAQVRGGGITGDSKTIVGGFKTSLEVSGVTPDQKTIIGG